MRSLRCTISAFAFLREPDALTIAVKLVVALVTCCRSVVLFFFNAMKAASSIVEDVDGRGLVEEESQP
jgi:hypothetical protein